MTTYYEIGSNVVAIETYCPGHGSLKIGIGADWYEARESLETTAVEGHAHPETGLAWAIGAGWFDHDTEVGDFEEMDTPTCGCQCGCDNEATTQDDGVDLCEGCANYAFDDEGTFLGCGNSGLGETCPHCDETIDWSGIQTGNYPGQPNYRSGDCGCGEGSWTDEDRGGWDNYSYNANDDEEEEID